MYVKNILVILGTALLLVMQLTAIGKTVEFSAEAVIESPQQIVKTSKIYVGKDAVRSESVINGQNIVEIVFAAKGMAYLINNNLRIYKEIQFPQQRKFKSINPCEQISNARCEKLDTENIDGVQTEKWQVLMSEQGRVKRSLHWIDIKRKLAIREFFPDGTVSELTMLNNETINSRKTEKWQRTLSHPDGQNLISYQWYDRKLDMAIKEELEDGFSRELKNIKIASQPEDLFLVPVNYIRVDPRY